MGGAAGEEAIIIAACFDESAAVKRAFVGEALPRLVEAAGMAVETLRRGGSLLFFGNGGSAADAQHLAAEFVGRFRLERAPLAALALTTDTSALTAIANDWDFGEIFARQVEALGKPGDLAIALSTSGTSRNVLRGVEAARARGLKTIGLTGGDGGRLAALVDLALVVPSRSTARIQEVHITIGHALCEVVDRAFARPESTSGATGRRS
ncbi:MAG TPA: D-sedoheptulose 7-phosphate isomerase, partial [Candidatus Methylomirabilis sp.]|nr:D-sedoheptulose 7-phosphate isomerase [Candidatus Methylomirabilis sp.]